MPVMLSEVYDALRDIGVNDEKARKAAEAVAASDHRFAALDSRMVALEGKVTLLSWMVGTNIVLTLGVLWKLLR